MTCPICNGTGYSGDEHCPAGCGVTPQGEQAALDYHIDQVLRAAGSGLRHYTMHSTREALRTAMKNAVNALSILKEKGE